MVPDFRSDDNRVVYEYWASLNAGGMPSYRAWDPICVAKQMPWCTVLERGGPTGFRLRFAGTAICDFYDEEMTGQAIGYKMDEESRAFYFVQIEEILMRPCGMLIVSHGRSDSGRDCLFELVALPMSDDSGTGARVMMHQTIIEEATYGEASSNFSLPESMEWIDIGAGVPRVPETLASQTS